MTIDAKEKPEERSAAVQKPIDQVEALTEQVAALTQQIDAITTNQRNTRQPARLPVCFRCNQPGHVQRNCPNARRCYTCRRIGHLAKAGLPIGKRRRGASHRLDAPLETVSPLYCHNVNSLVAAAIRTQVPKWL